MTFSETKTRDEAALLNRPRQFEPMTAVEILGVRVHSINMAQVLELVTSLASDDKPHHLVTVNPEFIMEARRNAAFLRCLNSASVAVPDGIGVVIAQRLQGIRTHGRIAGVDIVEGIAELSARHGFGIFLLGAAPGVAEMAAEKLQERYTGLRIAGTFAGSPRPEEEAEIISRITQARPHFLFVAYGAPRQDLWIQRNMHRLQVPVSMGVGGTFDFIAGVAVRAPRVFQQIGLEWFYRLMREPHRWRRMLALPRFAFAVLASRIVPAASTAAPETTPQ